jgi:hypothetical protein
MITPQQGMAFMQQMGKLQQPGGAGIGAPPAGSPTQGLIARLMSDNPGGLLGALMKQGNAPVAPGVAPAAGDPTYVPGGQGPMAGGPAPQMGMLAGLLQKLRMGGMGGGAAPGGPMNIAPPAPMAPPPMMPDIAAGGMGGGW